MPLFINPNPHVVTFTTGHKDSRKQHQIMPNGSKGAMPAGAIYEIELDPGEASTKELVKTGMLKLKPVDAVVSPKVAAVAPTATDAAPKVPAAKGGKAATKPADNDEDEG